MGAPSFFFLLLCGMLSGTIESEPSSIQDSLTSLKQQVLKLENSITSIPQMIREENEKFQLTILDEMEIKLQNYASTNKDTEVGETLRKELERIVRTELQKLLSNHSLHVEQLEDDVAQMNQRLINQTLLINKINTHREDVQTSCVGDPPSPKNGRSVDFERKQGSGVVYHCDRNFVATANSTVRCNFGKWEGQPPVCRFFDTSLTIRATYNAIGWFIDSIGCSSGESNQKLEFSRAVDSGSGGALPSGTWTYQSYELLRVPFGNETVLSLGDTKRYDRRGTYSCGYERDGTQTRVLFLISSSGDFVWPQMANVGDTVEMDFGGSDSPTFKWLCDGERVPAWDGLRNVTIAGVTADDACTYERYKEGERRGTQKFSRLIVRGCHANFFGERCDQECPPCYNGGVCHDLFGACICPPGFDGRSCEVACAMNLFGANCSERCPGGSCEKYKFCKLDPYGCSCARGFRGQFCNDRCLEGEYGANCKQTCHCAKGPCDPYTGACSEGCSPGWTGQSCQIPAGN